MDVSDTIIVPGPAASRSTPAWSLENPTLHARPLPASPVYIRLFESIAIMCARMNSPAWRPGLPKRSRMESRGEEMTLVLRILLLCCGPVSSPVREKCQPTQYPRLSAVECV